MAVWNGRAVFLLRRKDSRTLSSSSFVGGDPSEHYPQQGILLAAVLSQTKFLLSLVMGNLQQFLMSLLIRGRIRIVAALVLLVGSCTAQRGIDSFEINYLLEGPLRLIYFAEGGNKVLYNIYNERYNFTLLTESGAEINYVMAEDTFFRICQQPALGCAIRCFGNYCDTFSAGIAYYELLDDHQLSIDSYVQLKENPFDIESFWVDSVRYMDDLFSDTLTVVKYLMEISFNSNVIDTVEVLSSTRRLGIGDFEQTFQQFNVFKAVDKPYLLLIGSFQSIIKSERKDQLYFDLGTPVDLLHKIDD